MDHRVMNEIANFWRKTFFIEPILLLVFLFSFIVALLFHHREKERIFFLFYFFVGVLLFAITSLLLSLNILSGKIGAVAAEGANTIFELVEFVAFYYFFRKCLQNKISKKLLKIFLFSFLSVIAVFCTAFALPGYTKDHIYKHSLFINVIEFFFIFTMCLAYFYELFKNVPKMNLSQRPSFLIVISAFFYSALMIPFFMLANDMLKFEQTTYHMLFAVHFILLIIMLLTISKTFLCKLPITI